MSSVDIIISFNGNKFRRSIKLSVPSSQWNGDKKRLRTSVKFPNNDLLNDVIGKWETAALITMSHFREYYNPVPKEEFFARLDKEFYNDEPVVEAEAEPIYFCDYMQKYIDRYTPVRNIITVRKYYTAMHKLQEYEKITRKKFTFEDIGIDFYNNFQAWFYTLGYADNYFGVIIKIVKQMHREARFVDKLHTNEDIQHKDFIVVKKDSDNIYLSEEELLQIHELDISTELIIKNFPDLNAQRVKQKITSLILARDRFLIGAYTGLRVSDFGRLSEANIDNKYIRIKTVKTGSDTVVPIHPIIREIIASDFDASVTISDQKINNRVKELAMLSGICEDITVTKHVGGKMVEVVEPKYKLVSSHTARRSFATNAYKAGVPTLAIMKITGHTKESTFLKYIKVSAEENAEMLSRHPFFTGGE